MSFVRNIAKGIKTISEYLEVIKNNPERLHPDYCPRCGFNELHFHGSYDRKPDREGNAETTLNPVPIMRYACLGCHQTCSTLPECIAPRRWYLWSIQQAVLVFLFKKNHFVQLILN